MINVRKTYETWFEEAMAGDYGDWSDLYWCFALNPTEFTASIRIWIPGPDGKAVSIFPGWRLLNSGKVLDEKAFKEGIREALDVLTKRWNEEYPDRPR